MVQKLTDGEYSLIEVTSFSDDGTISGIYLQDFVGTIEKAVKRAKGIGDKEGSSVAVVPKIMEDIELGMSVKNLKRVC